MLSPLNIFNKKIFTGLIYLLLSACQNQSQPEKNFSKEELGKRLFFDTALSINRQQNCASCHDPFHGFVDARKHLNSETFATSLGTHGKIFGGRNVPTAAYAMFSPVFKYGKNTRYNSQQPDYHGYLGGQFLDGREPDLAGQAGGPPLNPVEMQMPNKKSVVERLKENHYYQQAFQEFYGEHIFDNVDNAYLAMTKAIESFEKSPTFAPFDSKYDRVLKGEAEFSFKELSGKALFFSQQFTNCATCHQRMPNGHAKETFSNYEYHNIGVPENIKLTKLLGKPVNDQGLFENPAVDDIKQKGKFKVPTLRNIAVTEPYMHNGVFQDLETVILFYDKYLIGSKNQTNPETGHQWLAPEVTENIALKELKDGRKLKPIQVEQMVCFLRTLTDKRYEHLIKEKGINCQD